MSSPVKRNMAASVAARLLNQARRTGEQYQELLTAFAFERFLHRLGVSSGRDRFVLKGAMLLRLWSDRPYRATRDLDLLRKGDDSAEAISTDLATICSTPVDPDGIVFDLETLSVVPIRAGEQHVGSRSTFLARCGPMRLPLQVDVGVGDSVWPPPRRCPYPSLLDFAPAKVLAYPREAVVAEKLEALIVFGDANTRIKDFFDLQYLAQNFSFDRQTLRESIRRALAIRATPISVDPPIGLTMAYWENPSRPAQVRAFARRARLPLSEGYASEFTELLAAFLLPLLEDLRRRHETQGIWSPSGPWATAPPSR